MRQHIGSMSSFAVHRGGVWAAGLAMTLACATPALAVDGPGILRQVDRRLQHESYEAYRKLINIKPDGSRKEFVLYTLKKGRDKVVALFLAPASEKGRATLRLGDNMWLYIPNVGRPIRITSLQSVTGGIFNNSDILRLEYAEEYDVKGVKERGDTYLLSLVAKHAGVAYDRLEMEVDRAALVPRTIRCLAASGMLIKTLTFSQPKNFGGGLTRPSVIETVSPLQKGYRSVMVYAKIKSRVLRDEVFTLSYLPRVEELR